MAIRGKIFAVALLYIYIADQQGHDSQENINDLVKNHENCKMFPHRVLLYMVFYEYICAGWGKSIMKTT